MLKQLLIILFQEQNNSNNQILLIYIYLFKISNIKVLNKAFQMKNISGIIIIYFTNF